MKALPHRPDGVIDRLAGRGAAQNIARPAAGPRSSWVALARPGPAPAIQLLIRFGSAPATTASHYRPTPYTRSPPALNCYLRHTRFFQVRSPGLYISRLFHPMRRRRRACWLLPPLLPLLLQYWIISNSGDERRRRLMVFRRTVYTTATKTVGSRHSVCLLLRFLSLSNHHFSASRCSLRSLHLSILIRVNLHNVRVCAQYYAFRLIVVNFHFQHRLSVRANFCMQFCTAVKQ